MTKDACAEMIASLLGTLSRSCSRYLDMAAAPEPGDSRVSAIGLGSDEAHAKLGLHVADFPFPMGDLVDLFVRAAEQPRATRPVAFEEGEGAGATAANRHP